MHIPRHPAALAASLLAVGALGTGVAIAATNPGDQDPDFNGGSAQLVNFPGVFDSGFFAGQYDMATQVAVAPDGSIYVGGHISANCDCGEGDVDTPVSLGHLDAAGNPIAAFGGNGVITDGEHRLSEGPTAFGFAADGDLLVGGSSRKSQQQQARTRGADDSIDGDYTVYRYGADGTFKDQAREDFEFGNVYNSTVRGFMPLADGGQLVMGSEGDGSFTNKHFATITLGADDAITGENIDDQTQAEALVAGHQAGSADGSYVIGGAGQVYTPPVNNDLRSSARISAEEGSPAQAYVLRRYNADGTRDDGYGGDFPLDGVSDIYGLDGSLAGDGATYLLAEVSNGSDFPEQQIVRFTAAGQRDTAFGAQTAASIFGEGEYVIDAVAGTPDGKVIVVATHGYAFEGSQTVVARLNADGTLDTTFGTGGLRTLTDTGDATYNEGSDAAVQSDGKAVVAGDMGREYPSELTRSSARAAGDFAYGEQQAFVTRLAADPRAPVRTTTTDTTATTTTTTTQTTTTTAITPPAATTPRPVAAQSVPKACASKRAFTVRLRIPRHVAAVSATVKVNGRQVKVLKGSRLRSTVNLRGLPKGTFKVSITVKLAHGKRSLKGTRTYHTCIPKQGDSIPVL